MKQSEIKVGHTYETTRHGYRRVVNLIYVPFYGSATMVRWHNENRSGGNPRFTRIDLFADQVGSDVTLEPPK